MPRRAATAESLQLSLFDVAAPAAVPEAVSAVPRAPAQIPAPMPEPAAPLRESVVAVFRHPQAAREIRLQEHLVAYALRRVRRRTIGFIVGAEGLAVNAPRWVGIGDIEAALREKADWILRKLAEQQDRAQRQLQAKVDWRDGAAVPFLGETVIVVLDPRATGAVLNTDALALPGVPKLTLHVGLPHTAQPEQIRDAVQSWLQRQARRLFEERCALFAAQLGVRVRRIGLSSATTRWGSANADGSVRLDWRLVRFGLPVIDCVVAHVLAHLREMNRSPAFWDVVRSVLPDYEQSRLALRDGQVPVFD